MSSKFDLKISNQQIHSQKRLICELDRIISNLETINEIIDVNRKEESISTAIADIPDSTQKD